MALYVGDGPYRKSPNIRFYADIVYTNHPPAGAYRGYGVPQGYWPLERHMEKIARELELDPMEFRLKNALRVGRAASLQHGLERRTGAAARNDRDLRSGRMRPPGRRLSSVGIRNSATRNGTRCLESLICGGALVSHWSCRVLPSLTWIWAAPASR